MFLLALGTCYQTVDYSAERSVWRQVSGEEDYDDPRNMKSLTIHREGPRVTLYYFIDQDIVCGKVFENRTVCRNSGTKDDLFAS